MADYAGKTIGGAGSGASAGASIGTSIMPGWGTAIGGIAGGLLGGIGGYFSAAAEEKDKERRREILEEASRVLGEDYNNIEATFRDYYKKYDLAKAYGYVDEEGNVDLSKLGEVGKKIQGWNDQVNKRMADSGLATIDPVTGEVSYSVEKFNYGRGVDDFLNPYAGNVIAASNAAVQHSAAGAGLGRSTGAAKAIAENTAKEYDKLYNTALNAYNTDRSQAYTEYSDYLTKQQDLMKTLLQADQWGLSAEQGLVDSVMEQAGEQVENLAGIKKDRTNQDMQIRLANAQI